MGISAPVIRADLVALINADMNIAAMIVVPVCLDVTGAFNTVHVNGVRMSYVPLLLMRKTIGRAILTLANATDTRYF